MTTEDLGKVGFKVVLDDNTEVDIWVFYYPDSVTVEIYKDEKEVFLEHAYRNNYEEMNNLANDTKEKISELLSKQKIIRYRVETKHTLVNYDECKNAYINLLKAVMYTLDTLYI